MEKYINQFFVKHLNLSPEDSHMLHNKYYKEYGLAIRGLNAHHKISAVDFNHEVDDALPLETALKPDPELRALLEDIDKSKVKLWLFTNAYINHAQRVIKLLEIEEIFEGCTYCDYHDENMVCKPEPEMFDKAEREAGAVSREKCYFIDDSALNCRAAQARGWNTVHFVEPSATPPDSPASKYSVKNLHELRNLFPHLFKSTSRS
ncbi:pyrimidine 5'-nucleotidase [Ascosphaera apis ARSEF 7405]|uniref:Pyrimidine 5'-nucleotidase n=1 Tax=Ascosphaera apis ARSEF 7405 TaxID=392613 RepID=A0A168DJM5_9EURO|nr:pyrimidine 5'-nucleotidase [Ascosphaera apis ARSEF 7405]